MANEPITHRSKEFETMLERKNLLRSIKGIDRRTQREHIEDVKKQAQELYEQARIHGDMTSNEALVLTVS